MEQGSPGKIFATELDTKGFENTSFSLVTQKCTSRWEEVCPNGSFKFMELLISHNKKTLDQLDNEIESLQKQLMKISLEDIPLITQHL